MINYSLVYFSGVPAKDVEVESCSGAPYLCVLWDEVAWSWDPADCTASLFPLGEILRETKDQERPE